jgi:hypothetical protein
MEEERVEFGPKERPLQNEFVSGKFPGPLVLKMEPIWEEEKKEEEQQQQAISVLGRRERAPSVVHEGPDPFISLKKSASDPSEDVPEFFPLENVDGLFEGVADPEAALDKEADVLGLDKLEEPPKREGFEFEVAPLEPQECTSSDTVEGMGLREAVQLQHTQQMQLRPTTVEIKRIRAPVPDRKGVIWVLRIIFSNPMHALESDRRQKLPDWLTVDPPLPAETTASWRNPCVLMVEHGLNMSTTYTVTLILFFF